MVKKIEDWVNSFERLLQIKAPVISLQECSRIKGINKHLFKQALKCDPIDKINKSYRRWRKRMAASPRGNPSPQVIGGAVS